MSYRNIRFDRITAKFAYEPETGKLFRRLKSRLKELVVVYENKDQFVSCTAMLSGYQIVCTHIMFMLMTKRWPMEGMSIDHRDGDVFNMRWSNLRETTRQQQAWNRGTTRWIGIEDGLERGVYQQSNGKYHVTFKVNDVHRHYGTYASKEEANSAARKIIKEVQGEFSYAASRKPKRSWRKL